MDPYDNCVSSVCLRSGEPSPGLPWKAGPQTNVGGSCATEPINTQDLFQEEATSTIDIISVEACVFVTSAGCLMLAICKMIAHTSLTNFISFQFLPKLTYLLLQNRIKSCPAGRISGMQSLIIMNKLPRGISYPSTFLAKFVKPHSIEIQLPRINRVK